MSDIQKAILPAREAVEAYGWTHQVQWMNHGNPCFIRTKTGKEADDLAERLRKQGDKPHVFDLRDLLQIH